MAKMFIRIKKLFNMPFLFRFLILTGRHIFILLTVFYCTSILTSACAKESYKAQREGMVKEQIISRGITDSSVVGAMGRVKRHLFVPPEYVQKAYGDTPLPIGYEQTISQPYIVAFMTEILKLKPTDRVLEIGTGSGYQAAILAEICDSVFSIEIVPQLGKRASSLLKRLGYDNIILKTGDGYKGWKEYAPFDAIIVTCSPTSIPEPLKEQLAEGGRMVIPVGERYVQQMVYLIKKDGELQQKKVLPVSFVPMVNEKGIVY